VDLFDEALPHASDSMEQFAPQGSPVTERVSFQSDWG
jgi:hypothetical protein